MISHYVNDSATAEWLLLSAELEHCPTGVSLERRNGQWIVDGVVVVNSIQNATELLTEAA